MTQYMVLLATFLTLLFRYTGQRMCQIGSPVAARRLNSKACRVFSNTIVLREIFQATLFS